LKVAVYSRVIEADQFDHLQNFFQQLELRKIEFVVWKHFYTQIVDKIQFAHTPATMEFDSELNSNFECMISLGGDGTLLDTIALVQNRNIPILGINFGRLGFLANIGKQEISQALDALLGHAFVTDARTLVHVDASTSIFGNTPYGLNEFAIHKQDMGSMLKVHTYLNGEFLNTYWADGIIVATPTGSTGYSLSCGGPIAFPESKSFVITPIAPHHLNVRPIVVPDTNVISFEVEGRTNQFICALDARKVVVPIGTQVALRKENFTANLIRLSENNFLNTLHNKLMWGFDKRN
jgi:NAD+ kinase